MSRLFTNDEFDLFCKICRLQEGGILHLMGSVLREYYSKDVVTQTKDYVYARGTLPIALVAHADTIHVSVPKEIFYDKEKNVVWSPEGLGADDRAGIYAIIDIIREGLRPTVIITNYEETGSIGARKFTKAFPKYENKVNFMIELDRQGMNDMVFYSCDNPEFENYLEPYGFKTDWGSFSDIAAIAPKWKVAAVNLSIGYVDEHTKAERLYVDWMFSTIEKVKNILQDELIEDHPFIFIEGHDYYSSLIGKYSYFDYNSASNVHFCDFCGRDTRKSQEIALYDAGQWWYLCKNCADQVASICEVCGKYFLAQDEHDTICTSCKMKEHLDEDD